jgi:AcrR family transcriptional regulator
MAARLAGLIIEDTRNRALSNDKIYTLYFYTSCILCAMTTHSPPGTPFNGKRARTRRLLIEAAGALIREKGFHNLSMEDVAARAGVSRGSIYGNFRDRNDLIGALAADRAPAILPTPRPGSTLREQMHATGVAVAEAARKHPNDTVYWSAYMTHVQSDAALKRRAEEQQRLIRRHLEDVWLEALAGEAPPMPIAIFVKVMIILTNGLIMAHSMSPEDFDEEVIVTAFEALAGPANPA